MKKIKITSLLIFWSIFLILIAPFTYAAEGAYGQATYGLGAYSKGVQNPPAVNLSEPINNSGSLHGNITFFFNATDESNINNCTLVLNNKANLTNNSIANATRISFPLPDLPVGPYNWSINCTDTLGNIGESPKRFFAISLMTAFNTSFNLTFTNLSSVDIRNVSNFVVEIGNFGRINFSEGIDLSQGSDLNKHIDISFNKIEINSTALPGLNKSATVQLVGLTFTNPRILRDGDVCPSSICSKVSYSSGNLIFNVTQWSSYSSEETPSGTPSPSPAPSGGGGGGGGGTSGGGGGIPVVVKTDFSVDKETLKVLLRQGESRKETLSIKNTGTTIFDVKAILTDIEKFKISPAENEVTTTLQPNEEKTIEFVFKALENEKPDIYPAKIRLKSPSIEKEIDTVVEVDSAQPLFDVDITVLPKSKEIFPGDELFSEINLFNVRGFGRVDVTLEYAIKDLQGNLIATEHETVAVETQLKFTKAILLPSDLKPGNYVAFAKAIYGDSTGVSSDLFEVKAKTIKLYPIQIKDYRFILLFAGAFVLIGILIFSTYKFGYFKKKVIKEEGEAIKQLKEEDKAQKLRKELEALESAYKSGFISEESYQSSKKRIEDKLNR